MESKQNCNCLGGWTAKAFTILGCVLVVGLVVGASPAVAQLPVPTDCQTDVDGANDQPGQKDLTQFCAELGDASPYELHTKWNWDEIFIPGGNTNDACTLYTTDSDSNANLAVCVTNRDGGGPANLGSVRLFTCNNTRPDRCSGQTQIEVNNCVGGADDGKACSLESDCATTGPGVGICVPVSGDKCTGGDNDGDLCSFDSDCTGGGTCSRNDSADTQCEVSQKDDDPFPTGDEHPQDTEAVCWVDLDDFGLVGASARLIDACSYPSEQVNSDPSDCILFQGCDDDNECDDGNECTLDTCDTVNGFCVNTPNTGDTCEADGDFCTLDQCNSLGFCESTGNEVDCDDGNVCTIDSCNSTNGECEYANNGGLPQCTGGNCVDALCDGVAGECRFGECDTDLANLGQCIFGNDASGTACTDDGLFCTGNEVCDGSGSCTSTGDPCSGAECNTCQEGTDSCFDPGGTSCGGPGDGICDLQDTCDGAGTCDDVVETAGTACEDGLFCTSTSTVPGTPDACDNAGSCVGQAVNCDDDLFCTGVETCNDTTNTCDSAGDPCPGTECNTCQEGTDSCFDPGGTSCGGPGDGICDLQDTCDGAGTCDDVVETAGTACEDGLFCTSTSTVPGTPDACDNAGSCVGQAVNCDDDLFCTGVETCNDTTNTCDSAGDPCPGTECNTCQEGTDSCFDPGGTSCGGPGDGICDLQDTCDGAGTCDDVVETAGTACEDGLFCTSTSTVPGTPDACDNAGSCVGQAVNCDDGLYCSGVETCNDTTNTCDSSGDPCSGDECNTCQEGTDSCFDPGGTSCGNPEDTDCNNPDTCDGLGTCVDNFEPSTTDCEDGFFCTSTSGEPGTTDNCNGEGNGGADCVGDPVDCDDGLYCSGTETCNETTDACDSSGDPCSGDECNTCQEDTDSCFDPEGTACGSPEDTDCNNPDTCDGSGSCQDNFELVETACGSPFAGECTDPDTCDGSGECLDNNKVCAYVTDSGLCPFDVDLDKGVCEGGDFDGEECSLSNGDADCVGNPTSGICVKSSQFRLLFTPAPKIYPGFKQNATNPGQYYYNLIYEGAPYEMVTLTLRVAYPFVTQGATPVHVYAGAGADEIGCFLPEDEIDNRQVQITIDDYINATDDGVLKCGPEGGVCGPDGEGYCEFDVDVTIPDCEETTCQVYVNTHLDWGLKGQNVDANPCPGTYSVCSDGTSCADDSECAHLGATEVCHVGDGTGADRYDQATGPGPYFDALVNNDTGDGPVGISNCRSFNFQHCVPDADLGDCISDETFLADPVQNVNVFKPISGAFGRSGRSDNGNATPGLQAALVRNDTEEVVQTGVADEDGYYNLIYKHRGRPSLYTVYIFDPVCEAFLEGPFAQEIELQGNGWAEANFDTFTCTSTAEYGKGRNKNKR